MHKNVASLLNETGELLKELSVTSRHKEKFLASLDSAVNEYKKKKLRYREYSSRLGSILRGKTRDEWLRYYDSYEYALLKKVDFIISQAAVIVADDRSFMGLKISSLPAAAVPQKKQEALNIDNEISKLKSILEKGASLPEAAVVMKKLDIDIPELSGIKAEIEKSEAVAVARENADFTAKAAAVAAKREAKSLPKIKVKRNFRISLPAGLKAVAAALLRELATAKGAVSGLMHGPEKHKKAPVKSNSELISFPDVLANDPSSLKKPAEKSKNNVFSKLGLGKSRQNANIFVDDIVSMERLAKSSSDEKKLSGGEVGIAFGWFSPKRVLAEFTGRFREKQEPILGEETTVPVHIKKLRDMRHKLYREDRLSGFDSTLLAQEAKRVKRILDVEKQEVYQGSSLGLIANVTVRKISLFLVNNFPQFFGYLYNALRAANVKVLSNTYVNIMVLVTMALSVSTFFLLLIVFFIINYPLYQIILRSIIFTLIAGALCATIFYVYPFMKIRERRRKTTTNLPFAMNHMSAVATSGVPPARMFELIAESGEYDEAGIEVKKIVDLTNIFGYDLLTAIRTVASTTPSTAFKKFLDGMVSTIETGGDLVSFLSEQADEAALTYKLERQRYNETVSTYSDIYTGVLIAAPLFFIAAMALVNMLGGSLGGLGVGVVMALGAYVVIPLLNIGFILFLQATQPDV